MINLFDLHGFFLLLPFSICAQVPRRLYLFFIFKSVYLHCKPFAKTGYGKISSSLLLCEETRLRSACLWCIRMFLSFFLSNAVTSYCGSSCFANIEWNEINLYANLITSFASGALRSRHTHKKKVFAKQQTRKFLDELMMMIYQDKTWQSFCIPQRFSVQNISRSFTCVCVCLYETCSTHILHSKR